MTAFSGHPEPRWCFPSRPSQRLLTPVARPRGSQREGESDGSMVNRDKIRENPRVHHTRAISASRLFEQRLRRHKVVEPEPPIPWKITSPHTPVAEPAAGVGTVHLPEAVDKLAVAEACREALALFLGGPGGFLKKIEWSTGSVELAMAKA